ncbi:MAG: DNA-binding response regulator [marine bacterium B5-7]|nr:MAG: DNA-binding response regulator [marine bacterium B5-7]
MRVLLVEDDNLLGDGLCTGLSQHGFTVDWLRHGQAALHALKFESFDAVIFDLGLPDGDGTQVIKSYRDLGGRVPILVLTARGDISNKLALLDGGADDYLVKPADTRELAARLRVLLRREEGRRVPVLRFEDIEVDPTSYRVSVKDQPVELTHSEFKLLHALIRNPGMVLSRERLEEVLYGWNADVDSNAIQVHLHNVRRKIGPDVIRTIRGVGYAIGR